MQRPEASRPVLVVLVALCSTTYRFLQVRDMAPKRELPNNRLLGMISAEPSGSWLMELMIPGPFFSPATGL
jgi:hypothetical protein